MRSLMRSPQVMSGSLPVEWSILITLETLELDPGEGSHGIFGTLPSEWAAMSKLQYISIANAPYLEGAYHRWD